MKIIEISDIDLFDHLSSMGRPVMEIELIRIFIPGALSDGSSESLFIPHFSLYHALYGLKFSAGNRGFYLHLDPMRIRLVRLPESSGCHYYMAEQGCFCSMAVETGFFCHSHSPYGRELRNRVVFDPMADFYLNPDNIVYGHSHLLDRLMKGMATYCLRKGEIDRALELFGISKPGKKIIQRKYYELALKYHPDKNDGSEAKMKEVNNAYHVLREVFFL
jgi:hypothetical protein